MFAIALSRRSTSDHMLGSPHSGGDGHGDDAGKFPLHTKILIFFPLNF
jgi:hypothetical protein